MTNRSTEGIQQTTTQKKILASEKAEREGGAERPRGKDTEREREEERESKRERQR